MSSITDVVKEGLKYPFNDGKKVLTLGAVFLASSLISLLMSYFVFDSLKVIENNAPLETVNALVSAIPPSNMALIVLSWIVGFVLLLFCSGYLYDVIKYGIEGRFELPEFNDIVGIFIKGIKSIIVGIAYAILPGILFLLGIMLSVNEAVGPSVNAIGGIILLIAMIFAIFVALFEVMAMCNMIAKDDLKGAFNFNEILALIKNIGWGRFFGILLFTVIAVMIISVFFEFILGGIALGISMLLGSALVLVLARTVLESLLVNPYVSIVISRVYGSIYREASNGNDNAEKADELQTAI